MKKLHIILLALLFIMVFCWCFGSIRNIILLNIPVNASLDDLCEISLEKSKQFKQLNIYDLKVGRIDFFGAEQIDSYAEIVLIDVSYNENSDYMGPYKLLFNYNLSENKLVFIDGLSNEGMVRADLNLDYQNWNIGSEEAISIYKNYLDQLNVDDKHIDRIYGIYDYDLHTPVWRILGVEYISIDSYTGEIYE